MVMDMREVFRKQEAGVRSIKLGGRERERETSALVRE